MKSIKKEDIKDLSYKDITNVILENNKKGMNTLDLFTMIVDLLELPKDTIDNKIGDYYTSLTTDKRFILLDNACWDLRDKHKVEIILDDEDMEDEDYDEESQDDEDEVVETVESEDIDAMEDEEGIDTDDDDLDDLTIIDDEDIEEE